MTQLDQYSFGDSTYESQYIRKLKEENKTAKNALNTLHERHKALKSAMAKCINTSIEAQKEVQKLETRLVRRSAGMSVLEDTSLKTVETERDGLLAEVERLKKQLSELQSKQQHDEVPPLQSSASED